ncbi:MAG: ABC transporter ATP-binding protein [Vulcanimicrobiaceae bacterium]
MMSGLKLLVELRDRSLRWGLVLACLESVAGTVPLIVVVLALAAAFGGRVEGSALAGLATLLVVSLALEIVAGTAAGRLVRGALAARGEAVRIESVARLRAAPMRDIARIDPGRAVALLTQTLDDASEVAASALEASTGGVFAALCALLLLFAIEWPLAILSFILFPCIVPVFWLSRKSASIAGPRLSQAWAEGTARILEYIDALAVLRAFGCTGERARRLSLAIAALQRRTFQVVLAPTALAILALFWVEFGFAVVLPTGGRLVLHHFLTTMRYVLAIVVTLRFYQVLFEALDAYLRLRNVSADLGQLEEVLALPARASVRAATPPPGVGVRLEHVWFAFDSTEVLRDVSCTIPARGVTAIVGSSGAGKTALAGVIAGLWEPTRGSVATSGDVALVFQDTYLFEDTVLNNIRAGRPGATDSEIRWAATGANCDDFVERLPRGYDTRLAAGGGDLSLGQRQRIAIARALLSAAPIVVLDESTASVDPKTESAVLGAIKSLSARKAVVLVTHRLSTVRNVAAIVVVADGGVAATGSHEALLASCPAYAAMWEAYERAGSWMISSA